MARRRPIQGELLALRDENFARFWGIYPRRVARLDALKAWQQLCPSAQLVTDILAAVAWQIDQPSWTREGGQFIPYPASWLRQGRWMDEPVAASESLVSDIGAQNARNGAVALRLLEVRDAARR